MNTTLAPNAVANLAIGRTMQVEYGITRPEFANHLIVDVTAEGDDTVLWFDEGTGRYGITHGPGVTILPAGSPLLDRPLNTSYRA